MKTTILFAAALAVLPLGAIASPVAPERSAVADEAKTATIDLEVSGMRWGVGCVKRVQSALASVPGVTKANVSMPDKALVTVDPAKVTTEDLLKAVKKAGYSAKERKKG